MPRGKRLLLGYHSVLVLALGSRGKLTKFSIKIKFSIFFPLKFTFRKAYEGHAVVLSHQSNHPE